MWASIFMFKFIKQLLNILNKIFIQVLIILITIYQKLFSLDQSIILGKLGVKVCLHTPSCSNYAILAIKRFGVIKGCLLSFFRILRCHPYSKNFYDPVPENFPKIFQRLSLIAIVRKLFK